MAVALSADPVRRLVLATPAEGARERHLVAAICAGLARNPEWADWDWIFDDGGRLDDLTVEGMRQAADAFAAAGASGGAWSIVVTTDRFFDPWRRVMDLTFAGRRHCPAPTLEAADQLLRQLRAEPALATPAAA